MSQLIVNTHDAKSRLSELIRAAERGDDVVVARNGVPVARIVAWDSTPPTRAPGGWRGRVTVNDDLVGSDDDVIAMFDESAARG